MTRRSFDPTWHGDSTLRDAAILANTPGERHDAAVTITDREADGHHNRNDTLQLLQALGLIPYDDQPTMPAPRRVAEMRGPNAKLSPRDILAMQVRRDNGATVKSIAEAFGVGHSTVCRLTERRAS